MHVIRTLHPALFVLMACCADDPTPPGDGGSDAQVDAAPAGPEAGLDAGDDAGRDGGDPDATATEDAGAEGWWNDGDWEPLPGLPAPCVIERAASPGALHRDEWESCGEGCARLLPDDRVHRAFVDDGGWHDGGRGYFWIVQRAVDDPLARRMVVLATTDGEPLGAWRGPEPFGFDGVCQVGATAVGGGAAAFSVSVRTAEAERFVVYHAALGEIAGATEPVGAIATDDGQRLVTSATTVAVRRRSGVVHVLEAGGEATLGETLPGTAHGPQVSGRHVFFSEYGADWSAAHGSLEQEAATFLQVASADVRMFRTDGSSFAWLQAYDPLAGGGYGRVELWTARYTTDPDALAPRMVREMGDYVTYTMGGGLVARRETDDGPQRTEVYDLSDGSRQSFVPPDGAVIPSNPIYVSAEEMLVPARASGLSTVYRVAVGSLPAD